MPLKDSPWSMMSRPWLSILLPTYNGAAHLPDALSSLRSQRLADVEILAVDDNSEDATVELLQRAQKELPLRLVQGPLRGNWVASANAALAEARGVYGCLLHQDDGYLPGRLDRLRTALDENADASLVVHWAEYRDERGVRLGLWRPPFSKHTQRIAPSCMRERLIVQNFFAIPCPVFRLDDARAVGGLDECLWYTADWDFWLKLVNRGPSICIPEVLAFFRVHAQSQTMQRSRDAGAFRAQLETVLQRHLSQMERDTPIPQSVAAAATAAIEINIALASLAHNAPVDVASLRRALVRLDLDAVWRFVRDTRIVERVRARVLSAALQYSHAALTPKPATCRQPTNSDSLPRTHQ